jgi:hypothetical protein
MKKLRRQVARDKFKALDGRGDKMEGKHLDRIGENMYMPRLAKETDEDYRCRIYLELTSTPNDEKTLADYLREEYEKNK